MKAVAGALAGMALVACVTDAAGPLPDDSPPRRGGTVTIALDSAPDGLNVARSFVAATYLTLDEVFAQPYRVSPTLEYVPELIDGEATVTEDPFTVTFKIRDEAAWSDGVPITSEDFEFTWKTMTDPRWAISFRDPPGQVERVEVLDTKTVRFHFGEPYAPWKSLFAREGLLPAHVLEGKNFDRIWRDEIPISSGPYRFQEWVEGSRLSLVRNEGYWDDPPLLDGLEFRFITDTNTVIQALRGGEVDVAIGQPELVPDMKQIDGLEVSVRPGVRFEYLEFDVDAIPEFVRRAISHAIDREAIVQNIARPALPDAEVLNSIVYLVGQGGYEPHFAVYGGDAEKAVDVLEDGGCERGKDSIFVCDGERLSYTYATIGGRERSERQFEIIEQQLRSVGIEVKAQLGDIPAVVEDLQTGRAQIASLSIDLSFVPFYREFLLGCAYARARYCDERVDELLERGVSTLDESEQERIYNLVDSRVARAAAFLPVYQVPNVLVWSDRLGGIEHGLSGDPFANLEEWFFLERT